MLFFVRNFKKKVFGIVKVFFFVGYLLCSFGLDIIREGTTLVREVSNSL